MCARVRSLIHSLCKFKADLNPFENLWHGMARAARDKNKAHCKCMAPNTLKNIMAFLTS